MSYFDTELRFSRGWVKAPNAYLAFGSTYAEEFAFAQKQGWPSKRVAGGHLHFLYDPESVAADVLALTEKLPQS
jgi:hypothetical protein